MKFIAKRFTLIVISVIVITELIVNNTHDSAILFVFYGLYKIISLK